jgi:hypothetical protein
VSCALPFEKRVVLARWIDNDGRWLLRLTEGRRGVARVAFLLPDHNANDDRDDDKKSDDNTSSDCGRVARLASARALRRGSRQGYATGDGRDVGAVDGDGGGVDVGSERVGCRRGDCLWQDNLGDDGAAAVVDREHNIDLVVQSWAIGIGR